MWAPSLPPPRPSWPPGLSSRPSATPAGFQGLCSFSQQRLASASTQGLRAAGPKDYAHPQCRIHACRTRPAPQTWLLCAQLCVHSSWFEDIGLISVYLSFCRINFYPVATDVLHAFMITNSSIHLGCKNLSVMDLNLLWKCNRKEVPVWRGLIQCSLCNQLANELISFKMYIKSFPVEIIF